MFPLVFMWKVWIPLPPPQQHQQLHLLGRPALPPPPPGGWSDSQRRSRIPPVQQRPCASSGTTSLSLQRPGDQFHLVDSLISLKSELVLILFLLWPGLSSTFFLPQFIWVQLRPETGWCPCGSLWSGPVLLGSGAAQRWEDHQVIRTHKDPFNILETHFYNPS